MNVIFYTPIPETKRLATVITDQSVSDLKLGDIIPKKSKTYSVEYDVNDSDLMLKIYHIEYMRFDNYVSPKSIVTDIDMYSMAALEDMRTKRATIFAKLDVLQTRALISNNTSLVDDIEKDKNVLRALPDLFDTSECNDILDVYKIFPIEMYIDYEEKYADRFKQQH